MNTEQHASIGIDLDQFKLHLTLPGSEVVSFHFDTPSRRFYLSVIALVAEQMRRKNSTVSVPLENYAKILALLNETVGRGAGSSEKGKLLPRIYRKWKDALPDLENAPLFKVVGRKKGFDDGSGKVYRFQRKTKDAWANLFEYAGSGEKVRLRFSVEKVGVEPNDIFIVYGNEKDTKAGSAWERFIASLQCDAEGVEQISGEKDASVTREPGRDVALELSDLLKRSGDMEKIPLKTRLELITRLATAPGTANVSVKRDVPMKPGHDPESHSDDLNLSRIQTDDVTGFQDSGISKMLFESISMDESDKGLYTAPELKNGRSPSPQSEVYALGVLLYQVVVGDFSRPLDADWKRSVSDDMLREDIAACVEPVPEKRLATPLELSRRLLTLDERRRLMLPESTLKTQTAYSLGRRKRRWIAYGFALVIILALLVLPALYYQKMTRAEAAKRKAYENNLPKIRQLLENEKYVAAHALARETEKIIPDDPTLRGYIQDATSTFDIETMPAGARVSHRPYSDLKGPWIDLGVTPIQNATVPIGMHRFRIHKKGYVERDVVRTVLHRDALSAEYKEFTRPLFGDPYRFDLFKIGRIPDGMVSVDRGRFIVALKGVPVKTTGMLLDRFFIDETEVTNGDYKEFVDAGGYADQKFWKQEFKKNGQVIPWTEAIKQFADRTGRPGPSTWELGDYPKGHDDYPVSGVSWYEAAAYTDFRGKSLPTIYHWARAAFPIREITTPLTPLIIPQSNIEGDSIAETGSFPGIGSSGAKDMAGNVREWCWNAIGESRYCLGGTWRDPAYIFNESCAPSAWDRSDVNGFRCVVFPEDAPVAEKYLKEIDLAFHNPYAIPAYSKKTFKWKIRLYLAGQNPPETAL
ncbi:MAG: SUMF1/EgtB/PvdO family nonheme iron enzyme [Deltaproteobacteria bacterium]|nr:SUMF1/EgtB/PvdO family nonheme iron enzyme [Deltaproteobacteria bacterium]